jgi:hypothetical protein
MTVEITAACTGHRFYLRRKSCKLIKPNACGRDGLLVQYSMEAQSVEIKTRIFISYSRKDMAFADALEANLKARGFEVLIDREEIYAFEDWWKRIEALIGLADAVVFVLSPDALKSEVALKEISYAASLNKRFAPIVYRRVEGATVPEVLRRLNFIFFDDPEQVDASADKLGEALQTDIVWVRDHTKFGETARNWITSRRPNGVLLRPPALEEAERWIASRPSGAPEPTEETRAFIAESRRAATQRRNTLTVSLGAGLLLALFLAGLALWQRGIAQTETQVAEAQRGVCAGPAQQGAGYTIEFLNRGVEQSSATRRRSTRTFAGARSLARGIR